MAVISWRRAWCHRGHLSPRGKCRAAARRSTAATPPPLSRLDRIEERRGTSRCVGRRSTSAIDRRRVDECRCTFACSGPPCRWWLPSAARTRSRSRPGTSTTSPAIASVCSTTAFATRECRRPFPGSQRHSGRTGIAPQCFIGTEPSGAFRLLTEPDAVTQGSVIVPLWHN